MSGRVPRDMLRKLRKLSGAEMFDYLRNIYTEGFQDGLREGESEYDDAIIMTEDEARDRLTDEGFLRLIGGQE
jgi:hypothetical protein